jgi:hypothetical protein
MSPFGLAAVALAVACVSCGASAPTPSAPRPPTSATVAATDAGTTQSALTIDAAAGEAGDSSPATAAEFIDASSSITDTVPNGTSACNEQSPQDFLVRANFRAAGPQALERAIQYRTDTYGYSKGFGHAPADAPPPSSYVVSTSFMNLPVRMHRKVIPALQCVEEEIRRSCADRPYTPRALAGIRFRNTYRGGEVTNHIYGIAIDIDPALNTCCGCVKPWNDAPACKRPAKTEYDRMAMPECWVHAFERYGFYWLGHDVLRDTMHFEFLGDPDRVVKSSGDRATVAAPRP